MTVVRVVLLTEAAENRAYDPEAMVVPEECDQARHVVLLTPSEHQEEARRQAHLLVTRCDAYVAVVESDLGPAALVRIAEEAEAWGREGHHPPGVVEAYVRDLIESYVSLVWRRTAFGLNRPHASVGQLVSSLWPGRGYVVDLQDWTISRVPATPGGGLPLEDCSDVRISAGRPLSTKLAAHLGLSADVEEPLEPLTKRRFGRGAREITARRAENPAAASVTGTCPSCRTAAPGPTCQFCHNTIGDTGGVSPGGEPHPGVERTPISS